MGKYVRTVLNCFECQSSLGVPNLATAEYNDSGVFYFTCSNGHQSVSILQQDRFELLFEIACNAINDGYYREAVTSFASSLERFYEYAINVICNAREIPTSSFDPCWKAVKVSSERQLGAFVFLWLAAFAESPGLLAGERAKFRNDVVHNGLIPTKDEAIRFGECIYGVIAPLRYRLSTQMAAACDRVLLRSLHARRPQNYDGPLATASMNSFTLACGDAVNLRPHLAVLAKQAEMVKIISTNPVFAGPLGV